MKVLLLNKKEFAERYGPFRIESNPLDDNLVRMRYDFFHRIKEDLFDAPEQKSISESYESKNPKAHFSSVIVECMRTGERLAPYAIWLTVHDLKHERVKEVRLATGDEERIMTFLNSTQFESAYKENVLYFNYEFKNYHTFKDYTDQLILRILKRAEDEVPEHGDFAPLFEFFDAPVASERNVVSRYGLEIFKMPYDIQPDPMIRYMRANAYDPSGQYRSGMIVGSGTKSDILVQLRSEDFANEIGYTFGELRNHLKDL